MSKQQAPIWHCPHGRQWGIGCRERECQDFGGGDNSYEAQTARASTGRRVPRAPEPEARAA